MEPLKTAAVALTATLLAFSSAPPAQADPNELEISPGAAHRGSKVHLSILNPALLSHRNSDGDVTVTSAAFDGEVALKPSGKVSWDGEGHVRCDVAPGNYTIEFPEKVEGETIRGSVSVLPDNSASATACKEQAAEEKKSHTMVAVWVTVGVIILGSALSLLLLRRRSGRPRKTH
ncbi:hypothetical protein [Streptomyces sp. NPDC054863]